MAKNDKGKKDKTKGGKQPKKGKGAAADGISVAGHPRAAAAVRRAKGFGGVGGFAIAAYVSYGAGVPLDQVAMRAVAVGMAGYLLAWACAVTVWRQLVLAELQVAVESGKARFEAEAAPAKAAAKPPAPEGDGQ